MIRITSAAAELTRPSFWVHLAKVLNAHGYAHVSQRAKMRHGRKLAMAPSVSLRNGERITVGEEVHIGERCSLWAGNTSGTITLGDNALLAPEVFITASNYQTRWGDVPIMHQSTREAAVVIGSDVWLGAKVVVLAGVTIGDGAVVGAASVVTRDLPAGSISVGSPARVVGWREGAPGAPATG